MGEDIANYVSAHRLISKIHKELTQFNSKKSNNPVKKWAKDLNTYLSKGDIEIGNWYMKRCSVSLFMRDILV